MTNAQARARVSRGATLLDRQLPGWEAQILLDSLDLSSCEECVLGQLYGQFSAVLIPEQDVMEAWRYGFDRCFWEPHPDGEWSDYDLLRTCWLDEIAKRTTEAPVIEWTHRETVTEPA